MPLLEGTPINHFVIPARHPGESRGGTQCMNNWTPASAGATTGHRLPPVRRAVLLTALAWAALTLCAGAAMGAAGLTGQEAPDFALKSGTGENLRLSEYRGDVVMLNFWATWCGPCRQEMPLLDEMYERYQKVGFTLLGVNIDEDTRKAKEMAETLDVSFPVLFDIDKEVSRRYAIEAMPVTVLIDRQGVVRHVHYGYKPGYEQTYLDELRSLLGE